MSYNLLKEKEVLFSEPLMKCPLHGKVAEKLWRKVQRSSFNTPMAVRMGGKYIG